MSSIASNRSAKAAGGNAKGTSKRAPAQLATFLGPLRKVATPARRMAITAAASPGPGILPFSIQPQKQKQWCWAAVAASVSDYYFPITSVQRQSQCQIATACLNLSCCTTPLQDGCDNVNALDDALRETSHLSPRPPIGGQAQFVDIKNEIANRRPVCCRISSDNGHFVVIVGCFDDSQQHIVIQDPADGAPFAGQVPYDTFANGPWDDTFFTT